MTESVPIDSADLRIALPSELSEQQLRSAIDRSLQLIARDLIDDTGEVMERRIGAGWMHDTCPVTGRPRDATDPIFWISHLKHHNSPVHDALPWLDPGSNARHLEGMRRIRNDLFHFKTTYDVRRTRQDLYTLLAVARGFDLTCRAEIETVRDHLELVSTGVLPKPPSIEEAVKAINDLEELRAQIADTAREEEDLRRQVDLAHEQLAVALEAASDVESERQRIVDLEAQVQRWQDEADIKARHEAILEEALDEATERATQGLPDGIEAAVISAAEYVAVAREVLRFLEAHTSDGLPPSAAELAEDLDAFLRKLAVVVPSMPKVPRVVSNEDLRAAIPRLDVAMTAQRLIDAGREVEALDASRDMPGQVSPVEKFLVDAVGEWEELTHRFTFSLQDILGCLEARADDTGFEPGDDADDAVDLPDPGQLWSWQRGSEVWVLSARYRRLHRPRSGPGDDFASLYGAAQEQDLVRQWLLIRPEGGRVYIDEDGDACTLGPDDNDIYLGRVAISGLTSG